MTGSGPGVITKTDLEIASICWGFTLGFGFLTTWEAVKQTVRSRSPLRSIYIWLVWGEIIVGLAFGIVAYLLLTEDVGISLGTLLSIVILWALKVHFLLQIIINRILVILPNKSLGFYIKWGTAALILAVNISVACIWIPARLGVSETFIKVNDIWDRVEKVIYLITDATLNWYFIRTVKIRLVNQGSKKYDRLVKFNVRIIFLSLAMDLLLIGAMSLKNGLVYVQFHPLAFIVKLRIELSMASLIRKIASEKNEFRNNSNSYEMTGSNVRSTRRTDNFRGSKGVRDSQSISDPAPHSGTCVMVHKAVIVESQSIEDTESQNSGSNVRIEERRGSSQEADETPLRDGSWQRVAYNTNVSCETTNK